MSLPAGTLTRSQWGAKPPARSYVSIAPTARPGVETHHSVGIYRATSAAAFARAVQNDHLGRGWTDVFYNFLVWLDGTPVEARPFHAKSGALAHLTVCFAGNYDNRILTDPQKQTWHRIRDWARGQGVGADRAYHGQRANVGCPGRDVIAWHRAGYPFEEDEDMLREGDSGRSVKFVQQRLNEWKPGLTDDGVYGPATKARVEELQQAAGLDVTGTFGALETWALDLNYARHGTGPGWFDRVSPQQASTIRKNLGVDSDGLDQMTADARYARIRHPHTVTVE